MKQLLIVELKEKLDCGKCASVLIKLYDPLKLAFNSPTTPPEDIHYFLPGKITDVTCLGSGRWLYTIEYEDALLTDPERLLSECDVNIICCAGCFYDYWISQGVQDTPTVDLEITDGILTAEVIISEDDNNCLQEHADGLYVACNPSDFIQSVTDTETVDLDVTLNVLTADVKISADAGNAVEEHADGIYVPEICVGLSTNISFVINPSGCITGAVIISADAGNQLSNHGDGLYSDPPCVADSESIDFFLDGSFCVTGDVKISADAGNQVSIQPDGLFVPAAAADFISSVSDTNSVDLSVGAGILTADVKISATAGNLIVINGDGIYATPTVLDSTTVDLSVAAGVISAAVKIATDVGNLAEARATGIYVPAQDGWIPFNVTLTRTNNTHFTIPGDWTDRIFVGTKIKLLNPTLKYFYVTAPSLFALGVTTVEAIAGDDYLLAAGAITDPFFSHSQDLNAGFPHRFNFTAAPTGFSVAPTYRSQFYVQGNWMTVTFATSATGTSNATDFNISLPKVAATDAGNQWLTALAQATDGGASIDSGFVTVNSASAIGVFSKSASAPAWTNILGKGANVIFSYPIL